MQSASVERYDARADLSPTDVDESPPDGPGNKAFGNVDSVDASEAAPNSAAVSDAPLDDSDQRETDDRQHVEHQTELGLPIEPRPDQNQRWAKEA